MSYHTVHLDLDSQKLCTRITPWDNYQSLRLPMGMNVSSEKMSDLMAGLEFVCTYLNDLLIISTSTF